MIDYVLQIFIYVTIGDMILSWIPDIRQQSWAQTLHKIANVPQQPIRNLFPRDIPLDPSPMIVIMLCEVLMYLI